MSDAANSGGEGAEAVARSRIDAKANDSQGAAGRPAGAAACPQRTAASESRNVGLTAHRSSGRCAVSPMR